MANESTKFDFKVYLQPAFLLCTIILALAAGTMTFGIKSLGIHLEKQPLPLRKSFDLLNEESLAPFKVISKIKIDNPEIVKSLGTEDYIQWVIEDTEAEADDPTKVFMLFVTYYSLPDRVPHVPEECYTGGGYEKKGESDVIFDTQDAGVEKKITGKYLLFGSNNASMAGLSQFPVLYFFRVNGTYASGREKARLLLAHNLFKKYAYFCKIELVFNRSYSAPSKEQAVSACEKILSRVLPLLEKEHWPEWEK